MRDRPVTTVSINLTQFGLDLSESECFRLVSTLVNAARQTDRRVEIDMESTAYTERTLKLVQALHAPVWQCWCRYSGVPVPQRRRYRESKPKGHLGASE